MVWVGGNLVIRRVRLELLLSWPERARLGTIDCPFCKWTVTGPVAQSLLMFGNTHNSEHTQQGTRRHRMTRFTVCLLTLLF
jgi:hypothetical protein